MNIARFNIVALLAWCIWAGSVVTTPKWQVPKNLGLYWLAQSWLPRAAPAPIKLPPLTSGSGSTGTITSVATIMGGGGSDTWTSAGCDISIGPSPITTTITITGTSYTISNTDCGGLTAFSNVSPVAVTLPQANTSGQFISGWFQDITNYGRGAVTIKPHVSRINNGAPAYMLAQGDSARIVSDGRDYQVIYRGGGNHINAAGSTSATISNNVLYNYSGTVTSATISTTSNYRVGDTMILNGSSGTCTASIMGVGIPSGSTVTYYNYGACAAMGGGKK